jgi:hypothetical protein
MKKTIIIMAGIVLSLLTISAYGQQTPPVNQPPATQPPVTEPQTWDAKKNPTVDSIISKYQGKLIPPRDPLTIEQIYPVIGQYQSTVNADAPSVKIYLDADNKGLVWIEGLPQGKIKAMLRKSPATYKIPSQKTEDGKEVEEGTLIFDKDANTLNIVIGKPYMAADPASVFLAPVVPEEPIVAEVKTKTSKNKTKVKAKEPKSWSYSGTKVETTTAMSQQ